MADGEAAAPASAAAAAADGGDGRAKTPSDFLKSIKGKPVVVKLNSGVDYRGERSRRTKGEQELTLLQNVWQMHVILFGLAFTGW